MKTKHTSIEAAKEHALKSLSKILKRLYKDYTMKDLSEISGIPAQALTTIKNLSLQSVSLERLLAIAEGLNIDYDYRMSCVDQQPVYELSMGGLRERPQAVPTKNVENDVTVYIGGNDGAGKSTIAAVLTKTFKEHDIECNVVKGRVDDSEQIRSMAADTEWLNAQLALLAQRRLSVGVHELAKPEQTLVKKAIPKIRTRVSRPQGPYAPRFH